MNNIALRQNKASEFGISLIEYVVVVLLISTLSLGAVFAFGDSVQVSLADTAIQVAGGGSESTANAGLDPATGKDTTGDQRGVFWEENSNGFNGSNGTSNMFSGSN